MRIYVACLASYNAGTLHGVWIDCEGKDSGELEEEVAAMLRESEYPNVEVECPDTGEMVPSAEEWAIHDSEGLGDIGEHESLDDIAELAEAIGEHGDAYLAYIDCVGSHYATPSDFEDRYRGEFNSELDYAYHIVDELYNLDEMMGNLSFYFDYERFARDLFINDCTFVDGHVFDK